MTHEPAKAAHGSLGWCPVCETGGRERPCWFCGFDGPFTSSTSHLVMNPQPYTPTPTPGSAYE